jgi:hypothetical protein
VKFVNAVTCGCGMLRVCSIPLGTTLESFAWATLQEKCVHVCVYASLVFFFFFFHTPLSVW